MCLRPVVRDSKSWGVEVVLSGAPRLTASMLTASRLVQVVQHDIISVSQETLHRAPVCTWVLHGTEAKP